LGRFSARPVSDSIDQLMGGSPRWLVAPAYRRISLSIENFDEACQNQCVGEACGQPLQMLKTDAPLKVNIMSVVGAEQIVLAAPAAGPRRRVLLADADETNAMFEAAALELLGWTVVRVRDGSSAVALATAGMFDLVMIEFRMPLLDGVEAARAIRRFEETSVRPRLPIVALTASVMPHEIEDCTEAGVDEVLGKPFTLAGMQRALERWGTRVVPGGEACGYGAGVTV
jgi:CheY-like chemotaxis protein